MAQKLSDDVDPNPNIDSDLRDRVCRSMAVDVRTRPNLGYMLSKTSQGVANKTEEPFLLNGTKETDRDIQDFLQEMVYKADPPPNQDPPAPAEPAQRGGQRPPSIISLSS
ncbi:hypothetical protein F5B22DRAFT_607485 [Xylaria bambusicola]|uniref:uncharacterized protein n=1 Tax=Xylaria bambusicola TaxID=326684 RepID=UPI00200858F3|nr:uncharacterized protein F5B22DRAFT_607485 [Xylaria bambusicola]KAI0515488.1 hypothetical protein F5B22DRAFT_607485 [Xylaria bambusicola]